MGGVDSNSERSRMISFFFLSLFFLSFFFFQFLNTYSSGWRRRLALDSMKKMPRSARLVYKCMPLFFFHLVAENRLVHLHLPTINP